MLSPAGRIERLRYDEWSLVAAVIDVLSGVRAVIDPRGATTR
ncbi:hypothetical protein [Streptomyces sp. NPDC055749]